MKLLKILPALFFFMLLPPAAQAAPQRIVSLTPVGTEILFALGQGDSLIGVTKYCDYPPEALEKPKVGGYAEVNFETLLSRQADLLVLQDMHMQFKNELEKLKIPYLVVRQESVKDITDSIAALGRICGADEKAAELNARIDAAVERAVKRVSGLKRPAVLLCVSRELSEPQITTFYAAGTKSFYNELISLAGGKNVITDKRQSYPKISQEGMLALAPDVIIDLVGERTFYHAMDNIDLDKVFDKEYLKGQWMSGVKVPAVRGGRVSIIDGTLYLRPGPRLPEIIDAFIAAIHPEIR
ncbi:MAG: helical backbone metal receptor [Synergistaceae bacterium]|nr:helical backbone metal receptor [Synergistaceae bacterium]